VVTIEGLARNGGCIRSRSLVKHLGFQCGFCTPGMILGAYALLPEEPEPTRADIAKEMNDHLCRCGATYRIVEAIETAAVAMRGRRAMKTGRTT